MQNHVKKLCFFSALLELPGLFRILLIVLGFASPGWIRVPDAAAQTAGCTADPNGAETALPYMADAYRELESGQTAAAVENLESASQLDSCNPAIHAQLAFARATLGNLAGAVEALEYAITLGYSDSRATLQIGYWQRRLGNVDEANRAFTLASQSTDAEVAEQGGAELQAAMPVCSIAGGAAIDGDAIATSHMATAYERLDQGSTREAIREFDLALAADPCRPAALAQSAYAYASLGELGEAIDRLDQATERGHMEPRAPLQLAYWSETDGNLMRARSYFIRAARSGDADIATQARAELRARGGAPGMILTEIYAAPVYQSRFDNFIFPLLIRSGPVLTAPRLAQAYLLFRLTRDTRSTYGDQPAVFSENAAIPGVGLRFRPFGGTFTAYGEAGAAVDLVDATDETSIAGPSFQAGVFDFRVYGIPRDMTGRSSNGLFAEVYYDGSYYSRFDDNVIGYFQMRAGERLNGLLDGSLDLYVPLLAVGDTRGLEFNNLVETGVGGRWVLPSLGGMTLGAEYLRGFYLRGEVAGNSSYSDLRITLTAPFYIAGGSR